MQCANELEYGKNTLGLQLDSIVLDEFEKKTKHINFIFSNGIDFIYEFFKEPIPISMTEVTESDMTTTGLCIIRYITSSETEAGSLQLNPNRSVYSHNSEAKSPESDSLYSSESEVTSGDVLA